MFYLNKKHPMLMKLMQELNDENKVELKTYLSLIENYSPTMLSGVIALNENISVDNDVKARDILNLKEKILILRDLQYEIDEIYEVFAEAPEYSYLREELRDIIKES